MISKLKNNQQLAEFIRFCVVGVLCTLIDAAIFYTIELISCYQLALISGYCISLIVNYFLTVCWTFKVRPSKRNLAGVVSVHLFNLFVIRMGLMYVFIYMIGLVENMAYIPTLIISVILNFILIKWIIGKM